MKEMTAHDRFLERQRIANERALEMYGKAIEDTLVGGTGIMKDGKRIDPASIYKDAPPKQDVPETNFGNMAKPDYAWPTIEDYEKEVGFKVNDAFKAAWTMARTTNDLFKQMGEIK
jgi:hypothetical protein